MPGGAALCGCAPCPLPSDLLLANPLLILTMAKRRAESPLATSAADVVSNSPGLQMAMQPGSRDQPDEMEVQDDLDAEQEGLAWNTTIERVTADGLENEDLTEVTILATLTEASKGIADDTEQAYRR